MSDNVRKSFRRSLDFKELPLIFLSQPAKTSISMRFGYGAFFGDGDFNVPGTSNLTLFDCSISFPNALKFAINVQF